MAGRAEGAGAIHHQEAALNYLQHAAQIRTDNPEIYNQIGDNLRWQGKFDRAVEAYEKVPKDDRQSYGWALAGIGWTRCDQSAGIPKEQVAVRLSESRDAFEQAIAVNPEEPSRRRGLGETLRRLAGIQAADRDRLWTEAEEQLRESLHLRAGDPNTLTALGDLYLDRSSVLQQTAEIWAMAGARVGPVRACVAGVAGPLWRTVRIGASGDGAWANRVRTGVVSKGNHAVRGRIAGASRPSGREARFAASG